MKKEGPIAGGVDVLEEERRALAAHMTPKAAKLLMDLPLLRARRLEEMRFYAGQNACFVVDGRGETQNVLFSARDVDDLVTALCGYSRYAYETQLAQGFIPLEGGHRAGICGRVTQDRDGTPHLSSPTSVCIRVARAIQGASSEVLPYMVDADGRVRRTLLLGPPGCGKTTVLRDAAEKLAEQGFRVAVCDEREELFPEQAALKKMDVMRGADKATAIQMFLRAMSPQVILCDEIGDVRDVQALKNASRCGVGLAATAHAGTIRDVLHRPVLRKLYDAAVFERYLLLGRHGKLEAAVDARLLKGESADVGRGGDGYDLLERCRLRSGGRRNAAGALGSGDAPLHDADERRDSL